MESYNSNADNVTSNGTLNGDGSSMSTSLLEITHAPVSASIDNGVRTTNVINPNTQIIIPVKFSHFTKENEGEVRDTEVDRRNLAYQHIDRILGQALFELREHDRGGSRASSPLLNINLHIYEAINSTCPETKEHCCICLEEYSDREYLARIDCGHIYHMHCLKEWNKIENNCPICKRRVAVVCHFTLRIRAHLSRLAATNQPRSGSVN